MMNVTKKAVLFLLSVCLLISGSFVFLIVEASQSQTVTSASNGGTSIQAQTVIIPTPCFTISVPTGISLGNLERTETDNEAIVSKVFEVGISGLTNLEGKQVSVALSTPYEAFCMYCGDHVLPYEVYNSPTSDTPLDVGDVFYTFTEEKTVTGNIKVDRYDISAPGEYGGVLTFTFHVEDIPAQ